MLKVVTIGTDRKLFEENSAVLQRILEYAKKTEELHIIVFSLRKLGLQPKSIGNLHIYPTNSFCRLFYIFRAYSLGKKIVGNCMSAMPAHVGHVGSLEIKNSRNLVISTQDPFETGLVGWLLKKKFHLPLQLQIHTDFLSIYFKNSILNNIRVFMAMFLLPKADGIRVVSKKIANSLKKSYPNLKAEIKILPIFVDIERIKNTPITKNLKNEFPQFTFTILMASRLSEEKRIDLALRAIKRIVHKFPHVGLIIAGDGPEKNNLRKLSLKLDISSNVIFIGWQNELISYYKTANMFLVSSDYEGYGMTIIEAIASSCPVITTNVGIVPEMLTDDKNVLICPVGDEDCLVGHIMNFISDNSKRELFKQETKDSIDSIIMSKEEYINKYIGLLEDIVNKSGN